MTPKPKLKPSVTGLGVRLADLAQVALGSLQFSGSSRNRLSCDAHTGYHVGVSTELDVIVVGLGAMGSAAVYQLAKRGARTLGIDQYTPPHIHGSSHGRTRITRLAIGEGEQYVPLVLRSHELWREIERETGEDLLTITGGLIIGSALAQRSHGAANFLHQTIAAAKRYGIAHELLDAREIRRRFPAFAVRDDEHGYLEHDAGFLRPEACVSAQLKLAERHGAQLHRNERVLDIRPDGNEVRVTTNLGAYRAGRAVVTVGPWVGEFLPPSLGRHFTVYREVLYWFGVEGSIAPYLCGAFPIFIRLSDRDADILYGFPAIDGPDGGVKVATEQFTVPTTAGAARKDVGLDEIQAMQERVVGLLPGLRGSCIRATPCLYTCTPDFGFAIDTLPDQPQILIASPCSGHGFKHSAAIGEAIAELIVHGRSTIDLGGFRLARFE